MPLDDRDGVLVVPDGVPGLLWHPLPLPPLEDGQVQDPATWAARVAPGGRWALARRPSAGWTPPDPSWGASVPTAGGP